MFLPDRQNCPKTCAGRCERLVSMSSASFTFEAYVGEKTTKKERSVILRLLRREMAQLKRDYRILNHVKSE